MVQITALASCLQALFTTTADFLARWTGFIRRQRELTGAGVAQALVFRWMANPKETLEGMAEALGVSAQALQQHLGPASHRFFQALIADALKRLLEARFLARSLGLLDAFRAVVVEDATTVSVPAGLAGLFPGCGGKKAGDGAAAVKLLLRYELKSGTILSLSWHPGRRNDAALAARREDLPAGCLYLADLGFFGPARLLTFGPGRSWISRVPASTCVRVTGGGWVPVAAWLAGLSGDVADVQGELAESVGLPCRLVALRCPEAVAAQRRRKLRERARRKHGKGPSAAQLAVCDWAVFATNVAAAVLGPREVWVAYRCRWQIELLFKRAKGMAGWSFSHGESGERVLAELLAKVLGLLVLHWGTLLRGPALGRVSAARLMRKVAEHAREIAKALRRGEAALAGALRELQEELGRVRPRPKRRRKPNTLDLLLDPSLAA